ncbi:hypothetical protein A2U01_0064554, partial [Trifolium medium]|nr:hypothetical protein [Trifolium medium]
MLKALNAVCFGHFRVRAKVARFDHFESNEGGRGGKNFGGVREGEMVLQRRIVHGMNERKGAGESIVKVVPKATERVESVSRSTDLVEEVRVGEVLVKL